ncbi:MAG TPA: VOC family protein [Steroidobacteraceae bacterium]|nr:VOC family protein [Steroidobacteraceae bacterium]
MEFWHHHIGISVPDLDASIEWYQRVLGFQLARRLRIESIPAEYAMVKNGPMHIELICAPGAKPLPAERLEPDSDARTLGNKHGAFGVENVPAFVEEIKRRGADIVWVKIFPKGASCFVRDNAGNLLEFMQAPRFEERVGDIGAPAP